MTFEPPAPPGTSAPPLPPPVPTAQGLPWTRSSTDSVLAGVCGGLGRRLGIDPIVLRIVVVVLAFFGGAGIVLYAAAWLFMPADDTGQSVLEDAFSSDPANRTRSVLTGGALLLVLGIAAIAVFEGGLIPGMLVALAIFGLLLLLQRDRGTQRPVGYGPPQPNGPWPGGTAGGPTWSSPAPATYGGQPAPTSAPASSSYPTISYPPGSYAPGSYGSGPYAPGPYATGSYAPGPYATGSVPPPTYAAAPTPTATFPVGAGPTAPEEETMRLPDPGTEQTVVLPPPTTSAYQPYGGTYPAYGEAPPPPPPSYVPAEAPPPPPPKPPRERSYLGVLTVSVMLVVLGGIAVADVAGASVSPPVYVVSALAVVAAGLLLGAWVGRSRGLIALGIVLGFALGPVAVVDGVTGGEWQRWDAADVRLQPLTERDLLPSYDYGAGNVRLDLTSLAIDGSTELETRIDLDAGEVVVVVPRDLDVRFTADMGAGELQVFDRNVGGLDTMLTGSDLGDDGEGAGSLDLQIDVGIGRVEVRRAAA